MILVNYDLVVEEFMYFWDVKYDLEHYCNTQYSLLINYYEFLNIFNELDSVNLY